MLSIQMAKFGVRLFYATGQIPPFWSCFCARTAHYGVRASHACAKALKRLCEDGVQ